MPASRTPARLWYGTSKDDKDTMHFKSCLAYPGQADRSHEAQDFATSPYKRASPRWLSAIFQLPATYDLRLQLWSLRVDQTRYSKRVRTGNDLWRSDVAQSACKWSCFCTHCIRRRKRRRFGQRKFAADEVADILAMLLFVSGNRASMRSSPCTSCGTSFLFAPLEHSAESSVNQRV